MNCSKPFDLRRYRDTRRMKRALRLPTDDLIMTVFQIQGVEHYDDDNQHYHDFLISSSCA